jgi:hypothetical protein
MLGDEVDGLPAVSRGSDDLDVGQPVEKQRQTLPHAGLIVGNDDA